MTSRLPRVGGGGWRRSLILLSLVVASACASESNAQGARRTSTVRSDSAGVAWLLQAVRGADPLLCEMAVRNVDMHGWWSRGGPGSMLEVDSSAAALIAWIQTTHNDPNVVTRLRAALRDQDKCVRRVAGSFLGRIEHPSAVQTLIAALDDPSAETRQVAALGLGLGDEDEYQAPAEAIEPLMRKLRDESAAVRRSAAWALGALEAKGAMLSLIETMQRDQDPRVRQAAAWAIGRVGG
ncbi:MAG: HEAT repeat domain-containing protein [Gemmatimonadaceae bacterium]